MLGISNKGNNGKIALGNFILTMLVQIAWLLYEMLPKYPEPLDLYGIIIKSIALTLSFYGLNKVIGKENNAHTTPETTEQP